ncbi:hypothetical protein ACFXB3_01285 [Streptomyces sp. NPDC059447]|uniref:hypothetical protein n=1 Tax=Streptomyces sp. NPDC059447 TaxID=3346834 RepID=UPI003691D882
MTNSQRARFSAAAASIGSGVLLGLTGPAAGKLDDSAGVAVSAVFSGGWSWACYAFVVGYLRRSKLESIVFSSLGLTVGVTAYYLFKYISPVVPPGLDAGAVEPGEGILDKILPWTMGALVLGAPVGLLGNLARVPMWGGLLFRLTVPFIAFYETSMRLEVEASTADPVTAMTWGAVRLVACAAALALAGHTIWSWWYGRRGVRVGKPFRPER